MPRSSVRLGRTHTDSDLASSWRIQQPVRRQHHRASAWSPSRLPAPRAARVASRGFDMTRPQLSRQVRGRRLTCGTGRPSQPERPSGQVTPASRRPAASLLEAETSSTGSGWRLTDPSEACFRSWLHHLATFPSDPSGRVSQCPTWASPSCRFLSRWKVLCVKCGTFQTSELASHQQEG